LGEQARVLIEEMIVTLKLAPGSMWSESELAELTGFGRTPVHEALKRLEAHHLVRIMQRHGIQITEINVEQQLMLLETRRELERLVASRAARRRSQAETPYFFELASSFRRVGRDGDVVSFMRLHAEAEDAVLKASRNAFAATAITPCHAMSRRFYFHHHRQARDLKLACNYHADVMQAIAEGNEIQAARAADAVLDYVEAFTRATLDKRY
jgi:DNA-binding GntR family transcriptional regulator